MSFDGSFDRRRAWIGAGVVGLVWVLGCNIDALFQAGRSPDPAPPRLVFAPPPDGTAGEPLSPAVRVSAQDSAGTVDTSFDAVVTVTIGANPGLGTLRGTTTVNAARGVATFANLTINKAAQRYTLVATAPGARGATSPTFDITPAAAARLEFTTQPHSTMAGNVISPPVQVTAFDTLENVVASFTGDVTMALGTNPTGTTLGGTTTVPAANGVATFADLRISEVGRYTLTASASASGLASATSALFDITAGPPPPTGNLRVKTSTTGSSQPTSYTVTVDGGQSRTILANGDSITYEGLTATTHTVALTEVPANCTVRRGASHTVTVI